MRIITGKAKGLILKAPKGLLTRPTSDRIKESVFNILNGMIDFNNKSILDLFAGTGALGLEAISRGGAQATFVDSETVNIIKYNVNRAYFSDKSEIIRGDVLKMIKNFSDNQRQFDLIFCDPPYNKGLWQQTLVKMDDLNLLKSEGLLIIEHDINEPSENLQNILKNIENVRQIKYGHTTTIDIFKRNAVCTNFIL